MTKKHEEDCDGRQDFSDGIFKYCLCEARNVNTVTNGKIKHHLDGTIPQTVLTISLNEQKKQNGK